MKNSRNATPAASASDTLHNEIAACEKTEGGKSPARTRASPAALKTFAGFGASSRFSSSVGVVQFSREPLGGRGSCAENAGKAVPIHYGLRTLAPAILLIRPNCRRRRNRRRQPQQLQLICRPNSLCDNPFQADFSMRVSRFFLMFACGLALA